MASVPLPVDADHTTGKINAFDHISRDEGDQYFVVAVANHEHVVRTGLQQISNAAKLPAIQSFHPEPFEVGPVVLALAGFRQFIAVNRNVSIDVAGRVIPILDAVEPCDQRLAVRLALGNLDRLLASVATDHPVRIAEDRLARIGVGMNLHPSFDAVKAGHPTQHHRILASLRHTAHRRGGSL